MPHYLSPCFFLLELALSYTFCCGVCRQYKTQRGSNIRLLHHSGNSTDPKARFTSYLDSCSTRAGWLCATVLGSWPTSWKLNLGSQHLLGERSSTLSLTVAEIYDFKYLAWGDSLISLCPFMLTGSHLSTITITKC